MKKVVLIFSTICIVVIGAVVFTSCNNAKEKKTETQDADVTKNDDGTYNVETSDSKMSTAKKWPEGMPEVIPQCQKGEIKEAQDVEAGGVKAVNIVLSGLEADDVKAYVEKIDSSTDFKKASFMEVDGQILGSFMRGSDALSFMYDVAKKEMSLSYVGK